MAMSEARRLACEIFLEHNGRIGNKRIAAMVDAPQKTISSWKNRDEWLRQLECKLSGVEFEQIDEKNRREKKGAHHPNHKHGVYSSITYLNLSEDERTLIAAATLADDPLFTIKEDVLAASVRLKRITDHVEELRGQKHLSKNDCDLLARLESEATQLIKARAKHIEILMKSDAANSELKDVEDVSGILSMLGGGANAIQQDD